MIVLRLGLGLVADGMAEFLLHALSAKLSARMLRVATRLDMRGRRCFALLMAAAFRALLLAAEA